MTKNSIGQSLFVLGFMKCGTTAFFAKMSAHPNIIPPVEKETYFLVRVSKSVAVSTLHLFWLRITLSLKIRNTINVLGAIMLTIFRRVISFDFFDAGPPSRLFLAGSGKGRNNF